MELVGGIKTKQKVQLQGCGHPNCERDHVWSEERNTCIPSSSPLGRILGRQVNAFNESVPVYADQSALKSLNELKEGFSQLRPLAGVVAQHSKSIEALESIRSNLEEIAISATETNRAVFEHSSSLASFTNEFERLRNVDSQVVDLRSDVAEIARRIGHVQEVNQATTGLEERLRGEIQILYDLRKNLSEMLAKCKDELSKAVVVSEAVSRTKHEIQQGYNLAVEAHESLSRDFATAQASSEQSRIEQIRISVEIGEAKEQFSNLKEALSAGLVGLEQKTLLAVSNAESDLMAKIAIMELKFQERIEKTISEFAERTKSDAVDQIHKATNLSEKSAIDKIRIATEEAAYSAASGLQRRASVLEEEIRSNADAAVSSATETIYNAAYRAAETLKDDEIAANVAAASLNEASLGFQQRFDSSFVETNIDAAEVLNRVGIAEAAAVIEEKASGLVKAAAQLRDEEFELTQRTAEANETLKQAQQASLEAAQASTAVNQLEALRKKIGAEVNNLTVAALKSNNPQSVERVEQASIRQDQVQQNLDALAVVQQTKQSESERLAEEFAAKKSEIERDNQLLQADAIAYQSQQNEAEELQARLVASTYSAAHRVEDAITKLREKGITPKTLKKDYTNLIQRIQNGEDLESINLKDLN